jgi:uncharacterized protein (TIGR03437 family)
MSKLFSRGMLAAVVLALPIAVFADVTGTGTVIASGSSFSLDTGTVSSPGDFSWNGTMVTPQGTATGVDVASTLFGSAFSGPMGYSTLVEEGTALISEFGSEFGSSLSTSAFTPAVNDILVFHTNGGNYSVVLVTAISGSLTINFHTFISSTTTSGPTISGVVNNYSYIPPGFPNSGIAPGSIFVIFGSGMSQPASAALNTTVAPGLPTTFEGATLSVTVGTTTVTPPIYYATPTQIAAVLPSSTPAGTATITVTYNGATSAAFQFQVVPYALGFNTYYGNGSGLLLATPNASASIINYTNSAKPGETIVFYGSGLGADTADSDTTFTKTPHSVSTPLQVYFGPVAGTVVYAGSSGFPGYDQIDVTIPENAPLDCYVSVVGVTGSGSNATTTNFGSLPISASGGECTSALLGTSGTTISVLSGQTTVSAGSVFVGQLVSPAIPPQTGTQTQNFADANFSKDTGVTYSTSTGTAYSIGSCFVTEIVSSGTGGGTVTTTGLDAGTINLTGPEGSYTLMKLATGSYYDALPSNAIPSTGGTFTYNNGSGGADVGSFTAKIDLPNPILQWTNQTADATITRTQGVTVNWTGGGPGTYVIISGSSLDTNAGVSGSFTCLANQSDLTFTVPNYVTLTLPPGTGSLIVENAANFGTFTATGLNYGVTFGFTGVDISSTYQ